MNETPRGQVYGILAVGIIALGWSAILIRMADAPPLAIATYRMLGGAVLFLPFTAKKIVSTWRGIPGFLRTIWVVSGLFLALHFAFWIESLRHTSVASSVVLVTTNPIFAGLGGWVIMGEREGKNFWIGVGCTVAGSFFLTLFDYSSWEGSALGNSLAMGGAVMASGYLLCGRKLRRYIAVGPYVTLCYGLSGVFLALGAWVSHQPLTGFTGATWGLFALMALGPTLIGHTSVNFALAHLPPGKVSLTIVGEPVVATILAWWFLAEPLTLIRGISGVLIIMGIIWGSGRSKR